MIKGLYTAGAGMMVQMVRQDTLANNLANVNTVGYKRQIAVSRAFPDMLISRVGGLTKDEAQEPQVELIGGLGTGVALDKVYSDLGIGSLKKTSNPTDLALGSNCYFVVQTSQGERYTRNGQFKLNNEGLLTNQGYLALDTNNRAIRIQGDFLVDTQGNISVNGETICQLKIVSFENPQYLLREGDNLLASPEAANNTVMPGVLQGYVEESNVNAVKEMVELINVVRAYETMQKVVQAEDEITGIAINQVGSVV
ncbi:MAG: flagellar hook-basal body protein [Syntrophomonadaceae bacterium]